MAYFDAFSPKPAPEGIDWRGLNSSVDAFVDQRRKMQAVERGKRAADLFASGDLDGSIRASGDPDFGLKVRGEQRLAGREPYVRSKLELDDFESRVKLAQADPVYKRRSELKKQIEALEAMGETELAAGYRRRLDDTETDFQDVMRRYGVDGPPPPMRTRGGTPGAPAPAAPRAPSPAVPAVPEPTVPGIAVAPPAAPPVAPERPSVAVAPPIPGTEPPAPRRPGVPEYAMPGDPRIQAMERRQRLGQIIPGMGFDPDKSPEFQAILAQQKEGGKQRAEQVPKIQEEQMNLQRVGETVDLLERLAPDVGTGWSEDRLTTLRQVGERFGHKDPRLPAAELFRLISTEIVLANAQRMKGALSDKDILFLDKTVPSVGFTPEALRDSVAILKAGVQRGQWVAQKRLEIIEAGYNPNVFALTKAAHQTFPSPPLASLGETDGGIPKDQRRVPDRAPAAPAAPAPQRQGQAPAAPSGPGKTFVWSGPGQITGPDGKPPAGPEAPRSSTRKFLDVMDGGINLLADPATRQGFNAFVRPNIERVR